MSGRRDTGSRKREPLPKLLHFLAVNSATGAALGTVFAIVLMLTNVGGLADLIGETSNPVVPIVLMIVGFATLIGGLYTGSAVMLLPWEKTDSDD